MRIEAATVVTMSKTGFIPKDKAEYFTAIINQINRKQFLSFYEHLKNSFGFLFCPSFHIHNCSIGHLFFFLIFEIFNEWFFLFNSYSTNYW